MFRNCESLTELNLGNFKTKKAFAMSQMFKNCTKLKKLDISNFIGDKIILFYGTFLGLNKLEEIYAPLSFINIAEIYENENHFNDIKASTNIYITDETPLKLYRKMEFNPLFNSFYIEEKDATNNTSKIILESDYYTFVNNKIELLPLSSDL